MIEAQHGQGGDGPAGAPAQEPARDPGAARRQRRIQRRLVGATAVAVVLGFAAMALPTTYVVESPGPAINTIGAVNGKKLIEVSGHAAYPAEGVLDLTTVYVVGGADSRIPFFDVVRAWFDPARDVYPEDTVYPRGATDEQISEENAAQMDNSQQNSVAAALTELDIDYRQQLSVAGLASDTNKGTLAQGDVLTSIDGARITDLEMLKSALQEAGDAAVRLGIERGGAPRTVTAHTTAAPDGQRQLGVYLKTDFTFPFTVDFTLANVGGPSAGMMFALGIVDTLTPGDMTGGKHFAGTGTITPEGAVGPIGGIAQKLVGAQRAGADYFLAPAENCPAVVGRIPEGLDVVKVATLEQARRAVEAIAQGADPASLPRCTS